jgi:hypothetical protein
MEAFMKRRFLAFAPFVFSALYVFATPIHAQPTEGEKFAVRPKYDIAREVTLTATVSSVVTKATPEMKMLAGSHLVLETSAGNVDASLGGFPLTGKNALAVTPGQRVEVTGVMKTIRNRQGFVTRLVSANGHTFKNPQRAWFRPRSRGPQERCEFQHERRTAMKRGNLSTSVNLICV